MHASEWRYAPSAEACLYPCFLYKTLQTPQMSDLFCDPVQSPRFETTHWSVVLQAGGGISPESQAALEKLCGAYWYPLYVHVRRLGWLEEDAKDLTQQFFARFLERKYLQLADPDRGRFRSFLLTALKNFLANEWEKIRTQKRGGQQIISWDGIDPESRYRLEPTDSLSPDLLYEKRWAAVLLDQVLALIREEYVQAGREKEFDKLKGHVWGTAGTADYATIAAELGVEQGSVAVAIHRLRKRFRECLRHSVARTVASPDEVEVELRHLLTVLSR